MHQGINGMTLTEVKSSGRPNGKGERLGVPAIEALLYLARRRSI
jgi:hypothetical protein